MLQLVLTRTVKSKRGLITIPSQTTTGYSEAQTFEMSSSWLARCARQWTQLYVRWHSEGRYAWNVFTISPATFSHVVRSRASREFQLVLLQVDNDRDASAVERPVKDSLQHVSGIGRRAADG